MIYQYRSQIKWLKFLLQEFSCKDMVTSIAMVMTISRTLTEKRTTDRLIGDMQHPSSPASASREDLGILLGISYL